jgi:hypothetical protein
MAAARYEAAAALLPELERPTSLAGYPHIAALSEGTLARYHAALGDDDGASTTPRGGSPRPGARLAAWKRWPWCCTRPSAWGRGDCAGSLASFVAAL